MMNYLKSVKTPKVSTVVHEHNPFWIGSIKYHMVLRFYTIEFGMW